ncbi:MAG: AtpZ/AtpI family protein [Flavobacteriaceae bacterium]
MKKPLNNFLRLSGVGIQFGAVIWLCSRLGAYLDSYFETNDNTYTIIVVIVGFVLSMYSLIAQLKKIQDD